MSYETAWSASTDLLGFMHDVERYALLGQRRLDEVVVNPKSLPTRTNKVQLTAANPFSETFMIISLLRRQDFPVFPTPVERTGLAAEYSDPAHLQVEVATTATPLYQDIKRAVEDAIPQRGLLRAVSLDLLPADSLIKGHPAHVRAQSYMNAPNETARTQLLERGYMTAVLLRYLDYSEPSGLLVEGSDDFAALPAAHQVDFREYARLRREAVEAFTIQELYGLVSSGFRVAFTQNRELAKRLTDYQSRRRHQFKLQFPRVKRQK